MLQAVLVHAWEASLEALRTLAMPIPFFVALGLIVKGRQFAKDVIKAANEARINVAIHFTDAVLVAPILAVLTVAMQSTFQKAGISSVTEPVWNSLPAPLVAFVAVFLADFIGYWRHRIEHTPLLWPSHSVHHSDTEMTWLAIFRFHPINRLTTFIFDMGILLALGLPASALLAAVAVKHFYGAFIHANLPWTYGPLKYVFVSPVMHRWHHATDKAAYNTNYATVFSLFDLAFGTFRVPGQCNVPLGIEGWQNKGFIAQMIHPFRPSRLPQAVGSK